MRLGRDVLVLTQTATSRSIAFLSQSLNEGEDVCYPIICIFFLTIFKTSEMMSLNNYDLVPTSFLGVSICNY